MCFKEKIEYYTYSKSNENFHGIQLNWPWSKIGHNSDIIACDECFYPITFEKHIIDELKDENNISFAFVIPINKLFKKVGVRLESTRNEWQTRVFCPNCGLILSFFNPCGLSIENFSKIWNYNGSRNEVVIIQTSLLFRGSEDLAFYRFNGLLG